MRVKLSGYRNIPNKLKVVLELMDKNTHPMVVLRTACSFLGALEPETEENGQLNCALRMLGLWGPCLMYWYHHAHSDEKIDTNPCPEDSLAANFLRLLHKKGKDDVLDPLHVETMEISLILYAEHDFNASTFACKVTTATRSDIYSAICTGIGTLKGPLHGGANEWAMLFLEKLKSVEHATQVLDDMISKKDVIYGFGHRVYKDGDPRNPIIRD
jgi:2-methylcitrate synthase